MADTTRYPCPCCGYLVLDEEPGSYEICPICSRFRGHRTAYLAASAFVGRVGWAPVLPGGASCASAWGGIDGTCRQGGRLLSWLRGVCLLSVLARS
jgi:hypothetical protein